MDKYKLYKRILIVLLIIGVAFIAFYKFNNRDLTGVLTTNTGDKSYYIDSETVVDGKLEFLDLEPDTESITKFTLYDTTGTMFVRQFSAVELFSSYISDPEGQDISLADDAQSMLVGQNNDGKIHVTPELDVAIGDQCRFFLQGRLIIAAFYACFIALLYIAVNAAKEKQEDCRNNHGPIQETKKFIDDMRRYWQYMVYAAKADLKAEVANSYLNRLWWLLEPFFSMLVYVVVFGKIMGNNIQNYATFTFSSLLMWSFFNKTVMYSVKLVRNNRDIITKVYVPKFVLLISNMILNMIKLLFSLIVLAVMLVIFRVHIGFNIFWVLPAYLVMILFSFGISMILLHYGVYVDDLAYAVGILLQMAMFLSGIFYNVMTSLTNPLNIIMMTANPMAMCMDTMRNALLYNKAMNLPLLGMWFVISIILCYIGIHIVYKNENSYVKVI